jgi:hypothetical protein|tara:strand:- start:1604 stop:1765 length:162 start_codon:yes stop_codon:yes gene_type:complete
MIKLDEHVVEIDGVKYVPADVASAAVIEAMNAGDKLRTALEDFRNDYESLNDD